MIGDALQELLGLPGARYSCVADPTTGQVLGESGGARGAAPAVLLAWGSGAARFLAETDTDDLDDLIVTSRRSYHLVRQIGTGASRRLLVYLCLDRARGNLAAARRELASTRLQERLAAGARPAARRALPPAQPALPAVESAELAERSAVRWPAAAGDRAVPPAVLPAPQPSISSLCVADSALTAHSEAAVPRPRSAVTALPTRSAAAPPPPSRGPASSASAGLPPGVPGSGLTWANDVGTLQRLLAALRQTS